MKPSSGCKFKGLMEDAFCRVNFEVGIIYSIFMLAKVGIIFSIFMLAFEVTA
jgi:hypothetical protein